MIAKAFLVCNMDEIMEAKMRVEKLGIDTPIPKPKLVERDFCFPLSAMLFAFINDEGNIKTIIQGQEIILKYDDAVYERITQHFKHI